MNKLFFALLGFALLFSCSTPPEDIPLSSLDWTLKKRGVEQSYPATVPGTVHTDLMAAGVIPDVFFGSHEQEVQWVEEEVWEYTTVFPLTGSQLSRQRLLLELDGLDTYARVYLNDQPILEADNMFRAWQVDIKPFARKGENSLKVVFEPAAAKGKELAATLPYTLPEGDRAFVRKAAYHFGWDWGPRFVTAGIWKEGRIRWGKEIEISEIELHPLALDSLSATFEMLVHLVNEPKSSLYVEFHASSPDSPYDFTVGKTVKRDETWMRHNLVLFKPALWWTHGLGEQHMYTFRARIYDKQGGRLLDEQSIKTGIRKVELVQEPDSAGQSFYFRLNGLPLFAKGANYIPADYFPHRSPDKMEDVLKQAKDAHMNMLRVWGGGVYEDDRFYELCDEMGIMVWQDFMFANTMYPGDSAFLENVREEVSYQVKRLRHHPSIALWCGNNEISEGWYNWGWQRQLGYSPEDSAKIYADYQGLFEGLIPEVLAKEDPSRPYHPSSPMTGWGRKESLLQGDVHYWGVWWGMEPFEVYEQKIGRFHSEHGFQGIPAMASLQKFIPEDERKQGSAAMKTHQKHPTGYETIREYMARDYPVPEDFEDYVYVSQLLQARGISMATRAHRLNRPYTMGSLYWQLNDVWPVTSWSSIDYYGRPKALQYALKQDFAPLMLGVKAQGEQKLQVWVASDMLQDKALRLQVEEFDFSGELIYGKQEPLQVKALQSLPYLELALSASFRQGKSFHHFSLVEDDKMVGDFFHFQGRPKELPLETGQVTAQWISDQELEVQVQDAFQKNLYLEAGGITFDRNYFDALPGTYRLKVVTNAKQERRPEVRIKTLNALMTRD